MLLLRTTLWVLSNGAVERFNASMYDNKIVWAHNKHVSQRVHL